MKIVQVNTRDIRGGAALAAYRLHKSLRQLGQDSRMAVRWKVSTDPTVLEVTSQALELELQSPEWLAIQRRYLNRNLTNRAKTLFTAAYPGLDLTSVEAIAQADIIHLHWVSQFISPTSLKALLELGKPVVWTLHDMAPFTGGCHYSSGCSGYTDNCAPCPQLQNDPYHLPSAVLQDKLELLAHVPNLTIVTPSRWMAQEARQSRLLGNCPIHVIPNPIETDVFRPLGKPAARRRLGLKPGAFTFIAQSSIESRKEFPQVLEAIRRALQNGKFRAAANAGKIQFLFFGNISHPLDAPDIPYVHVGFCNSPQKLAELYSAADAFILPSLEDNLPNVMLEAISCGTPLIGFDVGGMPDVIRSGKTGWLAPVGDFKRMAELIVDCVLQREASVAMQSLCREIAETEYSMPVIGQRFLALYESLLQSSSNGSSSSTSSNSGGTATLVNTVLTETVSPPVQTSLAGFNATLGEHYEAIHKPVLVHALLHDTQELQTQERRIQFLEAEMTQKNQLIEAMETSKFWKLRGLWFRIKRRLGLPAEE
ncbi:MULTISPECIES: glycosyltransferase family 4 protein [unclassified Leptolyngbya]|uniref:glycosyltransferase family 4 protein n=1 Tax=unclassified Leptolyngbya TaxID=2650499 RepID=UPI001681E626|nr:MULTISPECIES: glycosyltransferase family 4 protein [unclassified Leptolyngbya]MBD1912359.1 glycosyltransferase family 4 protein [Leptolyngbya sp. FACHB-8]MBD2158005.1 glycosyltransferase family 4 protein [Leptolyngbya sp. FACHB-16]